MPDNSSNLEPVTLLILDPYPMRFIHCADLHIDSPLLGLDRYEGAPVDEVRQATRRAFENVVLLARDENVDFMLIGGDVFDGDWPDYNTGLFFVKQLATLNDAGIKVYMISGNHDAESRITRQLRWPPNVTLFNAKQPQTVVDEALGLAVHGQSYARPDVRDDLAAGYPMAVKGCFNVGLLHTGLTGRPGHESYAPTRVETLAAKGYNYWALGHVHAREVVNTNPYVVFPGNIQGRHVGELGEKGCELVTVDDGEIETRTVAVDVLRWARLPIDASATQDVDALLDLVSTALRERVMAAEGRVVAVRMTITLSPALEQAFATRREAVIAELRAVALACANGAAWLEKIELLAVPRAARAIGDGVGDVASLLARTAADINADAAAMADLRNEVLADLMGKLPAEVRDGPDGLRLDVDGTVSSLLLEAERLVLARMTGMGEAR